MHGSTTTSAGAPREGAEVTTLAIVTASAILSTIVLIAQIKAHRAMYRYTRCQRCHKTFKGYRFGRVEPHWTEYENTPTWSTRNAALCEACWSYLAPDERLPFYAHLVSQQGASAVQRWPLVKQAVLEGK